MARYYPMLAVLLLPALVMLLLRWGPAQVVAGAILTDLGPPQLVQMASDQPGTQPTKKTKAELRDAELKARLEYGVANGLLRTVAALAIIFALIQLISGWRSAATRPGGTPVPALERRVVITVAVVLSTLAIAYAELQFRPDSIRAALIFAPLVEAEKAGVVSPGLAELHLTTAAQNMLIAYLAAALLLTYLAALTIDSETPMKEDDRVVGLQFVLAIGAALFTAAILVNKSGMAFITQALDPKRSAALIAALNVLPDVWALAYTGFLLTAVATAYLGIRGDKATVHPEAAAGQRIKDSPVALRTPDGKDFKIFGWFVNLLIASAPVWLPGTLTTLLKTALQGLPK